MSVGHQALHFYLSLTFGINSQIKVDVKRTSVREQTIIQLTFLLLIQFIHLDWDIKQQTNDQSFVTFINCFQYENVQCLIQNSKWTKFTKNYQRARRGFMEIYMYNQTLNKYLAKPNCDTQTSFDKSFLSSHH